MREWVSDLRPQWKQNVDPCGFLKSSAMSSLTAFHKDQRAQSSEEPGVLEPGRSGFST